MSKKNRIIVPLSVFILSSLFFLTLLETSLRISGYLVGKSRRQLTAHDMKEYSGRINILCIGDSYTWGGLLPKKDSYPGILQKMLDKSGKKDVNIINWGVCEYNSAQSLDILRDQVELDKVDCIIILSGAANLFNLIGYHSQAGILENMRVYKMVKVLSTNLKSRLMQLKARLKKSGPEDEYADGPRPVLSRTDGLDGEIRKKISLAWSYTNNKMYDEAEKMLLDLDRENPEQPEILYGLGHLYRRLYDSEKAEKYLKKAIAYKPDLAPAYVDLGVAYENMEEFDKAIAAIRKFLELGADLKEDKYFNRAFKVLGHSYECMGDRAESIKYYCMYLEYEGVSSDYSVYRAIAQQYLYQSRYDAENLTKTLNNIVRSNPVMKKDKNITSFIRYFENKDKWEKRLEKWIYADLEKMIRICRQNDIRIIIQNYPLESPVANRAIGKIVSRYSLPLVDNLEVFNNLWKNGGQKENYFLEDGHCTARGNRVMAENVYAALIRERIITDEE
ncbi:MAG: tetratricopeptide repeat protein [Elusimicrobia bacterium]|nr:tetratricopeptide repeat protein [Elusimicrobiota bacterium]